MAEINIDKMAQNVAEKALDEILYQGKSIREWMQIIASEDCISRQVVLDLPRIKTHNVWGNIIKESVDVEDVKQLPPVTAEPKTGHWIKYGIQRCGEQHYKCTSCGYYINFGQWGELYTKEFKYCPNCGCRMVEPQERSNKE